MAGDAYTVTVIQEGKCIRSGKHIHRKCNTILIQGPAGVYIVNPGSVWNSSSLETSLKSAGIDDLDKMIKGIICTDGRAEHVGCLSLFKSVDMMIIGYDITLRGDLFLEHDFGDSISPYEFDENFYVVGTPGLRGHQVSLVVNGHLSGTQYGTEQDPNYRIAITGHLFTDMQDASHVSFYDASEGPCLDAVVDKENTINCWRRSRSHILERADWIIPAYGPPFEVQPEYSSTPCVELA